MRSGRKGFRVEGKRGRRTEQWKERGSWLSSRGNRTAVMGSRDDGDLAEDFDSMDQKELERNDIGIKRILQTAGSGSFNTIHCQSQRTRPQQDIRDARGTDKVTLTEVLGRGSPKDPGRNIQSPRGQDKVKIFQA